MKNAMIETFKEQFIKPVENDVLVSMFGVKYTMNNQALTKVERSVFPLVYKTVDIAIKKHAKGK